MDDWVTISSLATAGGTLVLAVATFSSVRSANRSARVAEQSLLVGLRPMLVPSRAEDPVEKIRFGDSHMVRVPGHAGIAEEHEGVIYLALGLRNGGNGLAVLHGWRARCRPDRLADPAAGGARAEPAPSLDEFRQQQIDIFVPAGESGFWQGALRDPKEPGYAEVTSALHNGDGVQIDLLYGDQQGGQRTITRFILTAWPTTDETKPAPAALRAVILRYWTVDAASPR